MVTPLTSGTETDALRELRHRECDEFFRLPELGHLPPSRRIEAMQTAPGFRQFVKSAPRVDRCVPGGDSN